MPRTFILNAQTEVVGPIVSTVTLFFISPRILNLRGGILERRVAQLQQAGGLYFPTWAV